ncbi:jg12706 [Pararge aegeria aegeria]|uniref:Jg12706 protein n=1 Tax=Pararge aegeria aegeria TaxID=348720 RepID=A0A8S4S1M9_9NEOP|nr:jg12706 [Pararge aegeria aegeria]
MDVGVLRYWNGDLAPVNAALVGPQRGGQMPSGESLGAAGGKRPRTVYCGTPYKRPMSSSGRRLVDMMMMMMMIMKFPKITPASIQYLLEVVHIFEYCRFV